MGTAIKHPVPDRVKPSFVMFDIRALWRSEFACFSFPEGLLFYQLFIFQTGPENNANFDIVSSKRGNSDAIQ